MSPSEGAITHVSDTALMVAACRALEFESPGGFVQDPFAGRLAGERGMAILRAVPDPEKLRFGIGIRSRFMDELLLATLASQPIATVLSLGCGLDTRPWRLDLPPELRWIEVDFAAMLDYKDQRMSSETPRCLRERLIADVNDAAERSAIYATVGAASALMITEGLLMYLPAATIEALAAETSRQSGIAHWMADIMTTAFAKAIELDNASLRGVQAADFLQGEQILDVVYRNGWVTADRRSYITDMAFAMERAMRMMGDRTQSAAGPPPVEPQDPTGVHRFSLPQKLI